MYLIVLFSLVHLTVIMMPIFAGAPWVPKFDGSPQGMKYSEWKEQISSLIFAAAVNEAQAVSLVLGALHGDAKREILVLDEKDRDKATKIFAELASLYGDQLPLSVLRSKFFSCRQKPNEALRAYALRLRELHRQLHSKDADNAPSDEQLRDQLLLGLREGSLCRALKTYVRRNPDEAFAGVYKEALLLEEEHHQLENQDAACALVSEPHVPPSSSKEQHWKKTLKEELLGDLKAHLRELTQELWSDRRPASSIPSYERKRTQSQSRFLWDSEGKPICHRCSQSGHIGRHCRSRSESQPALNESTLPLRSEQQGR